MTTKSLPKNPFADREDGTENNGTIGYRLEKVNGFTSAQCEAALQLADVPHADGGLWLQKKVLDALNRRMAWMESRPVPYDGRDPFRDERGFVPSGVNEKIDKVKKNFTLEDCNDALKMPHLQTTVRKSVERRKRQLEKEADPTGQHRKVIITITETGPASANCRFEFFPPLTEDHIGGREYVLSKFVDSIKSETKDVRIAEDVEVNSNGR